MYTNEEIDNMTREEILEKCTYEERKATLMRRFDELMRSESKKYDNGLTVMDETIGEEKTYKNGKVIAIKKST